MLPIELIGSIQGDEELRVVAIFLAVVGAPNQPTMGKLEARMYLIIKRL